MTDHGGWHGLLVSAFCNGSYKFVASLANSRNDAKLIANTLKEDGLHCSVAARSSTWISLDLIALSSSSDSNSLVQVLPYSTTRAISNLTSTVD